MFEKLLPHWLLGLAALLACLPAAAQMVACSNDAQVPPQALVERFISADCAACWSSATSDSSAALALDWIVPSRQGDEAPLSSATSNDSTQRLEFHQLSNPATQNRSQQALTASGLSLRVAHGMAVNNYIGTSIELQAAPAVWQKLAKQHGAEITAHLALVERIPAGAEGSPIARILVRNLASPRWNIAEQLQKQEQSKAGNASSDSWAERSFHAFQPMSIPQGASSTRLAVVGWVENSSKQLLGLAQSVCTP